MADGRLSHPTHPTPPQAKGDLTDHLRLIRSRRVGPVTYHRLMAEHGTAAAALAALPAIAAAAGVTEYETCPPGVARAELAAGARAGAVPLLHGDPAYPAALADLPDAPPLLWCLGDVALLARPMVALVGARNASALGIRMARRLAAELGAAGHVVVSGLARGIDGEAHMAALETGTIAVQAGGVDVIYPEENAGLAADIARRGLRLSEQPPGLQPQARHFPLRNRIIAGLARAVVVIEAAAKSGSLITAQAALDQGREVMAVPGHPFDARAGGCNMLIRDGATLVRGAEDVLALLGSDLAAPGLRAFRPAMVPVAPGAGQAAPAAGCAPPQPVGADGPGEAGSPVPVGPHDAVQAAPGAARGQPVLPGPGAAAAAPGAVCDADRDDPPPRARPDLREVARLHGLILARLGPAPLAEDQLIRDLSLPVARLAPALLRLELEGHIQRQPGGLLSRV